MNSAEAMHSHDSAVITVRCVKRTGGDIEVSVSDTGHGISPDQLDRIFEAFYTTKSDGIGMGLSICRSIVEAHGGRIWATNNHPRGASFTFTLSSFEETAVD